MTTTTLHSFLSANQDKCFVFRGSIVGVQDLVNHYSVYLEAHVATDGTSAFFLTRGGIRDTPFAKVLHNCATVAGELALAA